MTTADKAANDMKKVFHPFRPTRPHESSCKAHTKVIIPATKKKSIHIPMVEIGSSFVITYSDSYMTVRRLGVFICLVVMRRADLGLASNATP